MSTTSVSPHSQVGRLINLIPVGLKEAALDSPTFRATAVHFADQVELIEKWLDGYLKSTGKLTSEIQTLENLVNGFLSHAMLPQDVSEAVLDHDYTVLGMKRFGEGAKDYWMSTITTLKRLDTLVVQPVRVFIQNDLRAFKDVRRNLDLTQKQYDNLQSRYSSQAKTKEPSALREDAFQLHEARKSYLKTAMDFCIVAPQLRNTLDKLLVRIFFDQWREMRISRDNNAAIFGKWAQEMERVKGWAREMETSEKAFRRDLHSARKDIEDAAEAAARPSRELEDYSISTVPYLGSQAPSSVNLKSPGKPGPKKSEKQGWLNLRTYTGKPTRTLWVRRWGFVKNGIFGWLVQGARSGGVEESERIGVLLCNVRPAFQEERRFCFELKTKSNAMMLQADTQKELTEWITVFDAAKEKALENPSSTDLFNPKAGAQDPAFAISPPPAPEFAANLFDSLSPAGNDEPSSIGRSSTLPVPDQGPARSSTDMTNPRRSTTFEREGESGRDHASRIIQKLDLHRKSTAGPAVTGSPSTPTPGGIASLIAASHSSMPVGPGVSIPVPESETPKTPKPKSMLATALRDMPPSTLAPSTLINPPAPTSLSKAAVLVNGDRGIGLGGSDKTGGMPSGMMANLWGSSNWGYVNRLERGEVKAPQENKALEPSSPRNLPAGSPPKSPTPGSTVDENQRPSSTIGLPIDTSRSRTPSPGTRHRKTISLDGNAAELQRSAIAPQEFPNYYPLQLKAQDAQFRLLFPNVRREEKLVLVFKATWNPNNRQEFPGRVYVTTRDIYFYSHHLGLVLTSGVSLSSISEVTAAPGRDCDFLFLHMNESKDDGRANRITIKTFLEPLKLQQRRLNFLVRESISEDPMDLESIIKSLIKMEHDEPTRSPSMESWEELSLNTPVDDGTSIGPTFSRSAKELKAPLRVDKTLDSHMGKSGQAKDVAKFKLPAQPVEYVPQGNLHLAAEKQFDISPKALFHVLFGDKSALWQLLQHERRAQNIKQGPWNQLDQGHMRRDFEYQIDSFDLFGRPQRAKVLDYQIVDVLNDHLCYVVTDKRTPWHLPYKRNFRLVSKIVITHVAKSKSKLAVFTKVEWLRSPAILRRVVERQAMNDLDLDALDLTDLISDQVRRLGVHSRTKKAINIFGQIGQQTQVSQFEAGDPSLKLEVRRPRQQRRLTELLLETSRSFLVSMISSVMIWTFDLLRWIYKTMSANRVILAILIFSLFINVFYSSRDLMDWWHERNAGKFMSRLGIQPNVVMSKAVYVRDVDEVLANETVFRSPESSSCYATFHETNILHDLDAPLETPSSSGKSTSLRLQRTRQRLGSYRHDLLVAMRVVNSIEREVLQTEWERWLVQENRRCRQVEMLLEAERQRNKTEDQRVARIRVDGLEGRQEEVERWFGDYCGSCRRELEGGLAGEALE